MITFGWKDDVYECSTCGQARRRALAMLWHRKETELALLIRQTQAKRVVTDVRRICHSSHNQQPSLRSIPCVALATQGIHLEKGPRTAAIKQFLRQARGTHVCVLAYTGLQTRS